jgi:hypothetical protein
MHGVAVLEVRQRRAAASLQQRQFAADPVIRASVGFACMLFSASSALAQTSTQDEADVEVPASSASPTPSSALEERLARAEARLQALEQKPVPETKPKTEAAQPLFRNLEQSAFRRPVPLGLGVSGYVQGQYGESQLSEDQLQQGGASKNFDRFELRRARVRVDHGWDWAAAMAELDGSSRSGNRVTLRRAEASLLARGEGSEIPLAMLTFGLFDQPFGFELVESARTRVFLERSQGSRALFPSEADAGARVSGNAGFFTWSLALVNGDASDGSTPVIVDHNGAKDLMGRVGVEVAPTDDIGISGGFSFLRGSGFHEGTEATKPSVVWIDYNENQILDIGETVGVPGSAATPAENFERFAFGLDLELSLTWIAGKTQLLGEAVVAQNLDRGLFAADPVTSGIDVRHLSWFVALQHRFLEYALVGFRLDAYDPNSDFLEERAGKLYPVSQVIRTYSPLVGAELPGRARVVFQYDFVSDQLGKDARGVPDDLENDSWALRLQVEL